PLFPPPVGVCPPPLPRLVAGEREADRAAARRGCAEPARRRIARHLRAREVLEQDAIEDLLACGQPGEIGARGEVGLGQRRRADDALRVAEGVARRPFHQEAGGPIGPAPYVRPTAVDTAAL